MNVPADLKYTKEHEWIKIDGDMAIIGITDFAQSELGDIVFIDVETIGQQVAKDEVFGSVEAVKTVSDLFMPISGIVEEMNTELEGAPEKVNADPYGEGWMVKVKVSDMSEVASLLDSAAYTALIG